MIYWTLCEVTWLLQFKKVLERRTWLQLHLTPLGATLVCQWKVAAWLWGPGLLPRRSVSLVPFDFLPSFPNNLPTHSLESTFRVWFNLWIAGLGKWLADASCSGSVHAGSALKRDGRPGWEAASPGAPQRSMPRLQRRASGDKASAY